jgi:RNA polymerase sigma-70 factor (ECF subfamily)
VVNTCHDANRINRRMVLEAIADEPIYDESSDGGDTRGHQLADGRESPHAYVERMGVAARIELGLRALPEEQRLALVLCDIHGYNYGEICAITGMPMGTIKSRISRARMRLRDFLLEQPELLA